MNKPILKSNMKRSLDHFAKHRRISGIEKQTRLQVKHSEQDQPLQEKILHNSGSEANRLFDLRYKKVINRHNKVVSYIPI